MLLTSIGPKFDNKLFALIVSARGGGFQSGSGVRYYLGEFDGYTFTPDSSDYGFLDYGSDFYAPHIEKFDLDPVPSSRYLIGSMSN